MQFKLEEAVKSDSLEVKTLKNSAISVPNSLYASKVFGGDLEIDKCYCPSSQGGALIEMWNQQHPLIHTWLVLSSVSICFLSALLFIIS